MSDEDDRISSFPIERLSPIAPRADNAMSEEEERQRVESAEIIFNSPPPSPSTSNACFRIEEVCSPPTLPPPPQPKKRPLDLLKFAQLPSASPFLSTVAKGLGSPYPTQGGPRGIVRPATARRQKSAAHRKSAQVGQLVMTTLAKNRQSTPGCSSAMEITTFESPKRVVPVEIEDINEGEVERIDDVPSPPKRVQLPGESLKFQSSFVEPEIKDDLFSDGEATQESAPVIERSPVAPSKMILRIRQESSPPEQPEIENLALSEPAIQKFATPDKLSQTPKDITKPDIHSFETPVKPPSSQQDDVGDIAVFQSSPEDSSQEDEPEPPSPPQPQCQDPEGTIFQESELPQRGTKSGISDLLKRANRIAERVKRDGVLFEYETSTGLRPVGKWNASPELVVLKLWESGSCFFVLCQPKNLQRFQQDASRVIVLIVSKLIENLTPGALVTVHFPVTLIVVAAYSFPFCLSNNKIRVTGNSSNFEPMRPKGLQLFFRSNVSVLDLTEQGVFFNLRPKTSCEPFRFDSVNELRACQLVLHDFEIISCVVHCSSSHSVYCVDSNDKVLRIDLTYRASFPDGCQIVLTGFHVKDVVALDASFARYILGQETNETRLYVLDTDGDRAHSVEMAAGALLPPRKIVTTLCEAFHERKPRSRLLVEVDRVTLKNDGQFEVKGEADDNITFSMMCHSTDAKEELLLSAVNDRKIILDGVFFDGELLVVDDLTMIR